MKRTYLPFVLCISVFALTLSACGNKAAEDGAAELSEKLSTADTLGFTAVLRAEYDDRSEEFTLDYFEDAEGCVVTVAAPDIIKGVSARIDDGETALEYEGVMLDTGPLDSYGLTPMSALPLMVEAIKSGYIDSAWTDGDNIAAVFIPDDNTSVEMRIDKYTKTPVSAEIASDGHVRVFAEIKDWS